MTYSCRNKPVNRVVWLYTSAQRRRWNSVNGSFQTESVMRCSCFAHKVSKLSCGSPISLLDHLTIWWSEPLFFKDRFPGHDGDVPIPESDFFTILPKMQHRASVSVPIRSDHMTHRLHIDIKHYGVTLRSLAEEEESRNEKRQVGKTCLTRRIQMYYYYCTKINCCRQ